jgi:signal transduction histidine kinase/CheY-like chemotaxis protein
MRQPLLILFLLLLAVTSNAHVYAADRPPTKSIRVVFGYENIGRWEQELTEEIAQVLLEDKRVIFHTEYVRLDIEDTSSYALFSTLEQGRSNDADAIIAVRLQASSFLNQWRDRFFPGIPIVYLAPGSGMVKSDLGSEIDAIVPSAIEAAARDTLELLPKLLPELEHIYILSGAGAADASYLNRIQSVIQEAGLPQSIHYLVGLTPSEMSAELNLAPKHTAAVFGLYSKDKTGRLFRTDDVVQLVSDQADRPLFGFFEGYLDRGVVGGSMTSAGLYGRRAAELTLALLFDDTSTSNRKIPNSYHFNAVQLERFGIDSDLLPEGSEVINAKPGLLQQYWLQFFLGGMVFIIQLLFIVALWRSLRRRNKAEMEREHSIAAMQEAQRIAHVGSWQLDLASNHVTWTEELYYMQGLDPGLPPPDYMEFATLFTAESWARLNASIAGATESGNPYELELENVKPDGTHGWMLAKGEVVRDASGSIVGLRGTALDTTERHAINEQLRRSQKMEAVGQLTGGIAHDFNNILAIIMGNLEFVKHAVSGDEEVLSDVNRALEGVARGAALIDKLLGFSRVHANETSPTLVNQLIENMDDMLVKSLMVSVKIETQLDAKLWSVNVDAGDLEGAILNLALNARDAMPYGGRLTIETANKVVDADFVRRQPEAIIGDYAMLSLSDTGIGMMPEVRDKVLEPFFTTKIDGKGTGLGLSMVYGFVKRSGGFITIYSEPGTGTSISMFLPREYKAKDVEATIIDNVEPPRGNEKLLVVDDEAELTKLATTNLERLGYKVLTACDGESALALMKDNPNIDLLFSDVIMPGELDGYLLSIAAKKTNTALKILLTSGFNKRNEDDSSADGPMFEQLTRNLLRKPYSHEELAMAIRKTLDER